MSCMQQLGQGWQELTERVERSGRWPWWVAAEPALASAGSFDEVAAIVSDRAHPQRADVLLAGLVRLGAVDGGNDQDAAWAVALLLTNGSARLARQLKGLSPSMDQMVAGQVWLQIREFPWHKRRRAIAANILLDARRAVLRDLGADTRSSCAQGVLVILMDTTSEGEAASGGWHALASHDRSVESGDDVTLVEIVQWAIGNGVVSPEDAATLLELAALELQGTVRGLSSAAEIHAIATRRGVTEKTVRRSRDRAVRSLAGARMAYLRECA
jgi:hypothetical protein